MPSADLCSEEEIVQLVYGFYDAVRRDEVLGPVFNQHVKNWDAHLPVMVDFWSSALRGTARFRGSPMQKHAALPGLSIELFQRWLGLFRQTTGALPNAALAGQANALAQRIAHSLWYGYQKTQNAALPKPPETQAAAR
ncbi:group III truncated hemoglobin [Polaromonas sp.]|uniref:group III truncated hemoglobin n=1 Tax=Polaromonas sp. TaxID=1869339 RepID=UPI003BB7FFA9